MTGSVDERRDRPGVLPILSLPVAIGSDHAGFALKEALKGWLAGWGIAYDDFGTYTEESCDYPDFALTVAERVASGAAERGVLICGTGQGMSMAANKVPGVRAALCHDPLSARLSREHNDANILVFGARLIGPGLAEEILRVWLATPFTGGRHARRVAKIEGVPERRLP